MSGTVALWRARLTSRAWLVAEGLRILRFGIVGVCAAGTHAGVIVALVELTGMHPFWANPIGLACALPVSYLGHYFFTWNATSAHGETVRRFVAVAVSAFVVSQALVMGIRAAGGPYGVAVALIVVLVPATNFVLFNLLVFARRPPARVSIGQGEGGEGRP